MDAELNNALAEMEARFNARFDKIDGRFDKIDGRFDKIDGRLDKIDGRLDKIERHLSMILYESGWYNTPPATQARNLKRAEEDTARHAAAR